ncbi:flagellar hook assembly protein FlgD [Acuticoccus sp. MNP-M23]|uniref:flagellar hook assembly protein FlgD n=1 Tax=Acuticoccus sp. MNP-M23 TaxID=3072793 RepID=UPI002814EED3|nr:flagellar hook assembly protein FlgD [Acuticoccus sp. MNP-M23]WMS41812.1 flagellar hook assembly protein FlgD [Acuticoccus sp. MNP-M23]
MNVVNPVAATGPAPSAGVSAAAQTDTLDYDSFLRLLVEQMKNQDPLEPMSDTEYIAQLASFSNVEQNIITNDRLQALMTSSALSDAQSLIGRNVTTPEGTSGTVASVQIASGEIYATLTSGDSVLVGDGITVSS